MSGEASHESPAVSLDRLSAFGDAICIRDSRGKSRGPALVRVPDDFRRGIRGGLSVRGGFAVIQRFLVSPDEGRAFVEASRDTNPLHVDGDVIPGAMTAARALLLPEMVIPGLAVKSLRIRFRAISRYDRASVNCFRFEPDGLGGFEVAVDVLQEGTLVAEASIEASMTAGRSDRMAVDLSGDPSLDVLRAFFRSLRIDPTRGLEALGGGYPRAFLAALPPGEMVRMGGAGGLLNALHLEFPGVEATTGALEPPLGVEIEPTRRRSSFLRVLARVGRGMVTYCKGYATVLATALAGGKGSVGLQEA
jgi:hypothetical protein